MPRRRGRREAPTPCCHDTGTRDGGADWGAGRGAGQDRAYRDRHGRLLEADTIRVLILPVLSALGWDMTDLTSSPA